MTFVNVGNFFIHIEMLAVALIISRIAKRCVCLYLEMGRYERCACSALCVCLLMSVALGRGTARCVCMSACPYSSPPGLRIDQLAWPNRRRGA